MKIEYKNFKGQTVSLKFNSVCAMFEWLRRYYLGVQTVNAMRGAAVEAVAEIETFETRIKNQVDKFLA